MQPEIILEWSKTDVLVAISGIVVVAVSGVVGVVVITSSIHTRIAPTVVSVGLSFQLIPKIKIYFYYSSN